MVLNSLICVDVSLRNYSLTHADRKTRSFRTTSIRIHKHNNDSNVTGALHTSAYIVKPSYTNVRIRCVPLGSWTRVSHEITISPQIPLYDGAICGEIVITWYTSPVERCIFTTKYPRHRLINCETPLSFYTHVNTTPSRPNKWISKQYMQSQFSSLPILSGCETYCVY